MPSAPPLEDVDDDEPADDAELLGADGDGADQASPPPGAVDPFGVVHSWLFGDGPPAPDARPTCDARV